MKHNRVWCMYKKLTRQARNHNHQDAMTAQCFHCFGTRSQGNREVRLA